MTFKAVTEQDAVGVLQTGVKIITFRRGAGVFFKDFPEFIARHPIGEVVSMCQSESDGSITLSIAYKPNG